MNLYVKKYANDKYILYFPEKLRIFTADKNICEAAELIEKGYDYDELKKIKPGLSLSMYQNLYENLQGEEEELYPPLNMNKLEKLVINISNTCNMNCTYCYAHGGNYHSKDSVMSKETLLRTLDIMYKFYPEIDIIQLFGGEPMLNPQLIKTTCEYIAEHKKETVSGMVSNGTIVTEELLEMVQKYDFHITVSIDIKQLHDEMRPFKNGTGSFEIIKNNIHKLRSISKEPSKLEVTYTKLHEDKGISINHILKELEETFPGIPVHMVRVATKDPEYEIKGSQPFLQSIEEEFEEIGSLDNIKSTAADRYLAPFRRKKKCGHFCHAGFGSLSVSGKGDIYPCSGLVDNNRFCGANIFEEEDKLYKTLNEMRLSYYNAKRNEAGKCRDCFANTLCSGCLNNNFIETGDIFTASDNFCNIVKDSVDKILIKLALLQEQKSSSITKYVSNCPE